MCGWVFVSFSSREAVRKISVLFDIWDFASRGEILTKTQPHTWGSSSADCLAMSRKAVCSALFSSVRQALPHLLSLRAVSFRLLENPRRTQDIWRAASSAGTGRRGFAARVRDVPLEYRARSVFCVPPRGFSSKGETALSLLSSLCLAIPKRASAREATDTQEILEDLN